MTTELAPIAAPAAGTAMSGRVGLMSRVVESHYVLPPDTPFELWENDGMVLQEIEKRVSFWLGDWLLAGEALYGESRYTQALKATGYAYQTLKNARHIARRFPAETRVHEDLAFGHYDAVAALPDEDADEILAEAAELKLSTKDVRERAKFRQQQIKDAENAAKPAPRISLPEVELVVGDALALDLPDACIDLIVTSPPYALEKAYDEGGDIQPLSWPEVMRAACDEAYRVAKQGGRFALNVPLDTTLGGFRPTYAQAVLVAHQAGWSYRSSIVWLDDQQGKSTARGSYDSDRHSGTSAAPSIIAPAETIILFSKGPWKQETPPERPSDLAKDDWLEWTNGVWSFPGESRPWEDHPAPFPLELPRRLITLLSFPGDLVLDQFLGSGTTAVAALKLGRRFIGVDQSPTYVAAAGRRLIALGLA